MNYSTLLIFILTFLCAAVSAQEDEIQLIPADPALGSELMIAVVGQTPGADLELRLQLPEGGFLVLANVTTDRLGDALARMPLPDVPPGDYVVSLNQGRGTELATTMARVSERLQISFDKASAVGGETVLVTVEGLVPGLLRVTLDGIPVIGPLPVQGGRYEQAISLPTGGQAELQVLARNLVGDRVMAGVETTFSRTRKAVTRAALSQFTLPAEPMRRGELNIASGMMQLPDGAVPSDYEWTMVIMLEGGQYLPVNIGPVQFDPPNKGGLFPFNVNFALPGVKANFPIIDLVAETDKFGFIYRNPDTGETDEVRYEEPFPFDDEEGIVITGLVQNQQNAPIQNAIVAVEAQTVLLNPNTLEPVFFKAGGNQPVSAGAAMMFENQVSESAKLAFNGYTETGCPITLAVSQTQPDGTYQIAFSPEQTQILDLLVSRELDPDSGNLVPSGKSATDEFIVRVSALHLDPAYGLPVNPLLPQTFTGVRYDFRRNPDNGLYEFREGLEGDYQCCFNPGNILTTTLEEVPAGVEKEILSTIRIEGMDPPNEISNPNGPGKILVFDRLITFPGQAATLSQETVKLSMNWASASFGPFDGVVSLDGLPSTALLIGSGDPCSPAGATYTAEIPLLAVQPGGVLNGRIEGLAGSTGFFKDIRIVLEEWPNWFESPAYVQPPLINWSAHEIIIGATEVAKKTDASRDNVPLDIGDLDNSNEETGSLVVQKITGGVTAQQTRIPAQEVSTFNQSTDNINVKSTALFPGRRAVVDEKIELPLALPVLPEQDWALADKGIVGSQVPITLFDTGNIPLFRYTWGVWPIASAVLGANYYFKALFYYYGTIEYSETFVDVDTVTEPSVDTGINVFFDFSAIFGLVSASLDATPNIGIGMPIVISDSMLDSQASKPCFQFRIRLEFEVSVGPCPLCIKGSYSDTPVKIRDPSGCSIVSQQSKVRKAGPPVIADPLAVASNGFGKSLAVFSDPGGIKVQDIDAGNVGVDQYLDSGPGAMRADVAWLSRTSAVAVWSQSALSESQFQARVDADYDCTEEDRDMDPDCSQQMLFDGSQDQHMVYSVYSGGAWGPTLALTTPSTGEGGVKLAACPATNLSCPPGGEVLAVWHRDMAADISQNAMKLYYAYFDGVAWSPPQAIDPSSTAKDVQPAPVYLNGEPVVVWVRTDQPSATEVKLNDRRLVYQFLAQGAGTQQVSGSITGVASPSVATAGNTLVVTYTASAPNDPFIGSRRALYVATSSNCGNGTCGWLSMKQRDQFDRDIFVEHPRVSIDDDDNVILSFRWVGTSGAFQPTDPFGIVGYGDTAIMQIQLPDVGNTPANVSPLTIDGATNWQTAAVFDPSIQSMMVLSAQVEQAAVNKAGFTTQPLGGVRRQKLASTRPVTLFTVPTTADLALQSAAVAEGLVVNGDDVITVRAQVANLGSALDPAERFSIDVLLDGPPGVGTLLGSSGNLSLAAATGSDFEISADIPSGVVSTQPHRLYVVVNPMLDVAESDAQNNTLILSLNQLPVPANIEVTLDRAGTTPIFTFDPITDPRVASFRVYRRSGPGEQSKQIGITPVAGFVDTIAIPGETYEYCFASLSQTADESDCSEWLEVPIVSAARGSVIFGDGFE